MRTLLAAFCLFAVTACFIESPTEPGAVDQTVTLGPGQSASITDTTVTLEFEGVTGDNRCPADAMCVLGGSATVKVEVASSSGNRTLTFETGKLEPVEYGGLTVELTQLAPYPFSASPIKHEDYRATLRVTRVNR
jgi:hypothetical protein